MYLWRKSATPRWLGAHEAALRAKANAKLTVIEQPGRKKLQVEVCCKLMKQARPFVRQFGGRIEKLSRDWLQRFSHEQNRKPIKIGKRLAISNVGGTLASRLRTEQRKSGHRGPSHIVIPAGTAFGTGDHATTAMSLRLLERTMRLWGAQAARLSCSAARRTESTPASRRSLQASGLRSAEFVVDLGTGSGILALAAKCFGARRVLAIDNDARAIATARKNARLNRIDHVYFRIGDARRWRSAHKIDIVTANLFSELLIEILPKLKRSLKHNGRMILSGVLRTQERELRRALRSQKIDIMKVRRRGKWVAMLARL
jgi:ribosomal protein L11 methyltransferase